MKRSPYLIAIGILVAVICIHQASLIVIEALHPEYVPEQQGISEYDGRSFSEPVNDYRESITFILGEDKEEDNPYYREATLYYSNHPEGRTDHLVTKCRSLVEARDYLEYHKPTNGLPWGTINLVSHGNQWSGLSVKVAPGSKRSTAERILEHIQDSTFLPLGRSVLDSKTELFLRGCGIGNNHALVENIAIAFGGEFNRPVTRASTLFEHYASVNSEIGIQTERYLTYSWFVSYKMGEQPSVNSLMNELRELYPDAPINWESALLVKKPAKAGDVYHDTFEVPVKWVIALEGDSFPVFDSAEQQMVWLRDQKKVAEDLKELNIPVEKFSWSFNQVYIDNSDGTKSPAILVKGYCTILCVLKSLTGIYDKSLTLQRPFTVRYDNKAFYYTSKSSSDISLNTTIPGKKMDAE